MLLLLSDAVEEPRGLEPLWQGRGRLLRGELGELAHLGRGRRLLGLEELLLLLLLLLSVISQRVGAIKIESLESPEVLDSEAL